MSAARRADGALGPDALAALVREVGSFSVERRTLVRRAQASRLGNTTRVQNSISLLIELGLLVESGDRIEATPRPRGEGDLQSFLRQAVLNRFCELLADTPVVSLIQPDGSGLRLDALQVPGRSLGYPPLLLQLGIASRDTLLDRSWIVADDCVPRFYAVIKGLNQADAEGGADLAWLASQQARREEAGRLAEAFALRFEIERLEDHPLVSQVRLISESHVAAGYDLLSFDRPASLRHDRMIEVKGYGTQKAFHWSEGEIEAAKRLRGRYWLYLVDLRQIDAEGYAPEMIPDPWAYFVEQNPEGWEREARSLHFSAPAMPADARGRRPRSLQAEA